MKQSTMKTKAKTKAKTKTKAMAILTCALLLPTLSYANIEDNINKTLPLANGGWLSLDNVNGDVEITSWDGQEVQIDALITASNQAARDRVAVEITTVGNGIRVHTDYKKFSNFHENQHAKVTYQLKVPAYTRLDDIELVNGALTINGVHGGVEASVVNGRINSTDIAGNTEINSVNGKIDVRFATAMTQVDEIDIQSVNGAMHVYLPASIDATIDAETNNGSIRNDFGFTVEKHRFGGREMQGRLGNGTIEIDLETVNGSINLHSLGQ